MPVLIVAMVYLPALAQSIVQPVAARYLPLGAYSQKRADIYAARSNVAALARLPQSAVALFAEQRFALHTLSTYAFSGGVTTSTGAFALYGNYSGFGLLNQSQLSLAYGKKLSKKADAGVQFNYHYLYQGGGYGSASSVNVSAGAIFHLSDKVHTGISVYNPTGSRWSKTAAEKIPARYTLGFGYEVSDKLYLGSEIIKEENRPAGVDAGVHYQFNKQFFTRAGISSATSSYFAAVGFQMEAFRADIAASYQSTLGVSPGILFLFLIGKKESLQKAADKENL